MNARIVGREPAAGTGEPAAAPSAPVIRVDQLSYTYPRATRPAVDGMTFTVGDGEIFGFLGPSGAGKTTTQQILIGLLSGWTGAVELLGRDVRAWDDRLYDRIGVSFELPAGHARLTVREELSHFALLHGSTPRDIDGLLATLDLLDAGDHAVGTLSKGMRVRLNLARAVLHRPRILFLDEPTAGLDPVTARRVRALLVAERRRGATILLTTHDMRTAELLCDRVAFVVDGRIAACDSPRTLKLRGRPRRLHVEYRRDGALHGRTFDLDPTDPELVRLLTAADLETAHTTEPSLDDVFAEVTGRPL